MATTFPYGYQGTWLTWEQMMTKTTVNRLHPEVRRRFKALIEAAAAQGVALGCGTGWRVQPVNRPGFARPGNSYHEGFPANGTAGDAMAIDTVPNTGWTWMERNCGMYGFRTFRTVNNEPWHIQPVEIPTSRGYAAKAPYLPVFNLPGTPVPPTPTKVFTVNGYRMTVKQGTQGKMAKMCQQQINLIAGQGVVEDGNFGSQSVAALKNVQTVLGCTADGICGQQTWQAMENGIKTQAESGGWD